MIDLTDILLRLSHQRPIFHSEADFQHALAWLIHERQPAARIRLEYRPLPAEPLYLDLWVQDQQQSLAIELKYTYHRLEVMHAGERFSLKERAAQPILRYDFIKDICRLERVVTERPGVTGYAILLTNHRAYWTQPLHSDTVGAAFSLHDGTQLGGPATWASHASAGTTKDREAPLQVRGSYLLSWREYSTVVTHSQAGRFRYLLVRVDSDMLPRWTRPNISGQQGH